MKERPILFSTPMVRAILEGRKGQTRRIVKPSNGLQRTWLTQDLINEVPQGELINGGWQMHHPYAGQRINNIDISYDSPLGWVKCPYGQIGDILWVRETFTVLGTKIIRDQSSGEIISEEKQYVFKGQKQPHIEKLLKWKPSIFMPKEASRIKLKVTNIRVERVQDITEEDAVLEGIESSNEFQSNEGYLHQYKDYIVDDFALDAVDSYHTLWESINGKDSWQSNPWVWVIEFERIK